MKLKRLYPIIPQSQPRPLAFSHRKKHLTPGPRLNFLLGCPEPDLGSFELARLAEVADLRSELHETLDKIIDAMAQAAVAAWFKRTDRETLKQALDNPEDLLAWAKERIRNRGKSEEEIAADLVPRASMPPGDAHKAAALRYAERNIERELCRVCPEPLARGSVQYCEKHLADARERTRARSKSANKPPHGRAPGTLAALAAGREKQATKVGDRGAGLCQPEARSALRDTGHAVAIANGFPGKHRTGTIAGLNGEKVKASGGSEKRALLPR